MTEDYIKAIKEKLGVKQMEDFRKQVKNFILDYSYYDENQKLVAIIKKDMLEELLQVDEVKFEE